ncbi:CD40 ligand [Thalassophryne amazonica]|uniref:CD40 ligand n=1 Tax=Thalassophryne amazonica TaxID=390379 RepID=UPI0014711922|nr:CD40 ligand [Thalassophryne amazonica]
MINTYQTSIAPPPVPPRLNKTHQVLIPAPDPPQRHRKSLISFFIGVVLLNLLLSVAGFIYLFNKMKEPAGSEAKAAALSSYRPSASAQMVVEKPSRLPQKATSDYLQWDIKHSLRRNINHVDRRWLTILQPGDYYVSSQVTFSRGDPEHPLASIVKLRKHVEGEEQVVMQGYCSLDTLSKAPAVPHMCTVTQGKVLTLETGDQLSVWVHNLLQVDYSEGATTFGLHKLKD